MPDKKLIARCRTFAVNTVATSGVQVLADKNFKRVAIKLKNLSNGVIYLTQNRNMALNGQTAMAYHMPASVTVPLTLNLSDGHSVQFPWYVWSSADDKDITVMYTYERD